MIAKEMDEEKGLNVQTSVFCLRLLGAKLSNPKQRKKRNCFFHLSKAQTVQELFLGLGESVVMSFIQE